MVSDPVKNRNFVFIPLCWNKCLAHVWKVHWALLGPRLMPSVTISMWTTLRIFFSQHCWRKSLFWAMDKTKGFDCLKITSISCSLWRLYEFIHYWYIWIIIPWRRHDMGTFSALLALYDLSPKVTGWLSYKRAMMWSCNVFIVISRNE